MRLRAKLDSFRLPLSPSEQLVLAAAPTFSYVAVAWEGGKFRARTEDTC